MHEADLAQDAVQDPIDPLGGADLPAALEALLILAADPVAEADLAAVTGTQETQVRAVLERLAADYLAAGRGFELRPVGGAWRFYSAATCSELVNRWVTDGRQARLSQAALETLAVVAYRQPVSRSRVSAIRGVNVDGVMRTLVARGLVAEAGADPTSGATLYGTTDLFLERLGIGGLEALPPIVEHLLDPADLADHTEGEPIH
jgi:segregation and condensation protein B